MRFCFPHFILYDKSLNTLLSLCIYFILVFFSSARRYNKSKYHLKDIVLGKIYFLLVRIKIKHMELAIIRREQSGQAPNVLNESETLTKFEIMDGAPVRGESIPVGTFFGFPETEDD